MIVTICKAWLSPVTLEYLFESPSSPIWAAGVDRFLFQNEFSKPQHFLTEDSFNCVSLLLILIFSKSILWIIVPCLCLYSARLVISLTSTHASFIPDSKFCTCCPLTKNAYVYHSCPSWGLLQSQALNDLVTHHLTELSRLRPLSSCLLELYWYIQGAALHLPSVLHFKAT